MELEQVSYKVHEPSYFNNTVHGKIRRVALDSSGTVIGVHNKDNTNLWEDGSTVDWSVYETNDWNCMVQIPKFYYKVEFGTYEGFSDVVRYEISESPSNLKIHPAFERVPGQISNHQYIGAFEGWIDGNQKLRSLPNKPTATFETRSSFRVAASLNGVNFRQQDFYLISAIKMLMMAEFSTLNIQNVMGLGRADGIYQELTGASLLNGNNSYGSLDKSKHMSYRGIENLYGNFPKFLDGINVREYVPYASKSNFADNVFTGDYVRIGTGTLPISTGYINNHQKIEGHFDFTFLPSSIGAVTADNFGDMLHSFAGDRAVMLGGSSNFYSSYGAMSLSIEPDSSFAHFAVTSRIAHI